MDIFTIEKESLHKLRFFLIQKTTTTPCTCGTPSNSCIRKTFHRPTTSSQEDDEKKQESEKMMMRSKGRNIVKMKSHNQMKTM